MQEQISYSQIPRALVACYQVGMELTLRIREIRKSRSMTLAELAGKVGISSPHLSGVERGEKNLNNHLLVRIAEALDVQPWDLIAPGDLSDLSVLFSAVGELTDPEKEQVAAFARALRLSRIDS